MKAFLLLLTKEVIDEALLNDTIERCTAPRANVDRKLTEAKNLDVGDYMRVSHVGIVVRLKDGADLGDL